MKLSIFIFPPLKKMECLPEVWPPPSLDFSEMTLEDLPLSMMGIMVLCLPFSFDCLNESFLISLTDSTLLLKSLESFKPDNEPVANKLIKLLFMVFSFLKF